MHRRKCLPLVILLIAAPALFGATKEQEPPDKELLKMIEFLRDMEMFKQLEMMRELDLRHSCRPLRRGANRRDPALRQAKANRNPSTVGRRCRKKKNRKCASVFTVGKVLTST